VEDGDVDAVAEGETDGADEPVGSAGVGATVVTGVVTAVVIAVVNSAVNGVVVTAAVAVTVTVVGVHCTLFIRR
jgi:hypothetical protein